MTVTCPVPQFHLFHEGDVVRVLDDLAEVHRLQDGHGGWNDDIALVSVGRRRGRERPCLCVL